jgi:hypothetical protein
MAEDGVLPGERSDVPRPTDEDSAARRGKDGERWPAGMKLVNDRQACSIRAQGLIQPPNHYGYIHLAGEVERPHLLRRKGTPRAALLAALKTAAAALCEEDKDVRRADVFSAFVIPPGSREGRRVLEAGGYDVHVAKFDVVVLVECTGVEAAVRVRASPSFAALEAILDGAARFVHCITARNAKRIAEVDKSRDGIFLFNYFFAADLEAKGAAGVDILLGVWEYTAGWWTAKANLTNSTLLQPLAGEPSQYSLINHCRWDRALDVLPHLIFRPSLESFVLKNFTANDIMAMPILYHLA